MDEQARVVCWTDPQTWTVEAMAIRNLDLPLNSKATRTMHSLRLPASEHEHAMRHMNAASSTEPTNSRQNGAGRLICEPMTRQVAPRH